MEAEKRSLVKAKEPSMTRLLGTENALRLSSLLHLGPKLYPLSISLYLFFAQEADNIREAPKNNPHFTGTSRKSQGQGGPTPGSSVLAKNKLVNDVVYEIPQS
ncbi:predicted protein [Aspergillus nidulans FGSC A4]|uniref:Uncharacterized protein n=1 Tax=Emericella nidulans (strain FGSC A4 / ATCC 38163 / CBS 112.46 / NRRL 194 / M139) TaxID=227321 RepID=Q5B333_EMENI|nr:hypothetical protein [Aspergillus nidulans FGSC A4]EAA61125.1 predicted protein [Aspergillus nidulans FGSC A4]CBF76205.1 TPA: hypothetical protein ANIA_05047 [Aspergillus nidulans FGSC A4]|eukprot:XP_662651.1 predicted protein [Aspergillus nidulans FGSC A4]